MRRSGKRSVISLQLTLWVVTGLCCWADSARAERPDKFDVPALDVLENRTFSGDIIPEGKSSGRAEEFVFESGRFYSKVCLDWGFKPGPYWVRYDDGKLHFFARLTSEENGVMTYKGTITGAMMESRVHWVRPRWYWTMERDFRFVGRSETPQQNR